jgi:phosphinothricin acetyltransferase
MNLQTLPVAGRVRERRLDFTVADARPEHVPEITAIYLDQIASSLGTFEEPLPDAAEMARRLAAVRAAGLPAFVSLDDHGRVLGFC